MRQHEAVVVEGRQYRLPSNSVVQVDKLTIENAMCRYVGPDGMPIDEEDLRGHVTLTKRFLEKFGRRWWTS